MTSNSKDRWPPDFSPGAIVLSRVIPTRPGGALPHNREAGHGRRVPGHGALAAGAGRRPSAAVDDLDGCRRRDQTQLRARGAGDDADRCRFLVRAWLGRSNPPGDRGREYGRGRGRHGHWGHGVLLHGRPFRGHLADHSLAGGARSAPCSFEPGTKWCRWPSQTWALSPCDTTLDNHGAPGPER